ncbi:MAG: Mth938-like domain-containing protein [Anaerolineae bacterium]|nr:Mth938-like domain-containing protein [Anaerolineae bacterium]
MPLIESYSFGRIVIEGRKYSSDVLVYPESVQDAWQRLEGHNLQLEDLEDALRHSPDVLVIGTGTFGKMKVTSELKAALEQKGVKVIVARTGQAVRKYNEMQSEGEVVAALHLTC